MGAAHRHGRVGRLRDPEIGHLHRSVIGKQYVLRLDVAVNDLMAVCVVERVGDLAADIHDIRKRKAALLLYELLERESLYKLHHDIGMALVLPHVDRVDEVPVGVPYRNLRLLAEAGRELLLAQKLGPQYLDGDFAAVSRSSLTIATPPEPTIS